MQQSPNWKRKIIFQTAVVWVHVKSILIFQGVDWIRNLLFRFCCGGYFACKQTWLWMIVLACVEQDPASMLHFAACIVRKERKLNICKNWKSFSLPWTRRPWDHSRSILLFVCIGIWHRRKGLPFASRSFCENTPIGWKEHNTNGAYYSPNNDGQIVLPR